MFSILGTYFSKHRGLANSIFASGAPVGGLIWAPVIVRLFDTYGYSGTMLIISGLLMNIFVSAALLRPMEYYTKRQKTTNANTNRLNAIRNNDKGMEMSENPKGGAVVKSEKIPLERTEVLSKEGRKFERLQSHDPEVGNTSPLLFRARALSEGDRHIHEPDTKTHGLQDSKSRITQVIEAISRSQATLYTSGEGVCGSFVDVNVPKLARRQSSSEDKTDVDEKNGTDKSNGSGCCLSLKKSILTLLETVFDVHLLKRPVFLIFMLMAFCFISGISLVPVYVPTHANDVGISGTQIGNLISIQAVIDLVTKMPMGVVADRGWLKRSTILATVAFLLGTASHLMRFATNFGTFLIYQIIAGKEYT